MKTLPGSEYYKRYIKQLIDAMPTTITLSDKTVVDDGWGGQEVQVTKKDYKVAMYDRTGRMEVLTDVGQSFARVGVTKLLAEIDIPIDQGELFTANGQQFRVVYVKPYFDICKQIEVEVIRNEGN